MVCGRMAGVGAHIVESTSKDTTRFITSYDYVGEKGKVYTSLNVRGNEAKL